MAILRELAKSPGVIGLLHALRAPVTWACQRGLLPPSVRGAFPWRWVVEPFTVYGDGWSFRWYPTESDTVGMYVFWHGLRGWERETVPVMLENLSSARCFFDVGANSGIYSVMGCTVNPDLRVVSVEPVPRVYETLVNNVRQNRLDSRVTALNLALGDRSGSVPFFEAEDPQMGGLHIEGPPDQSGQWIEVDCRTLDSIVEERGLEPDFVKIDVEGFEHGVLRGASRLLSQTRPRIVLEANPGGPSEAVTEILTRYDYRFRLLTDDGPAPADAIVPHELFRNWLCLPA